MVVTLREIPTVSALFTAGKLSPVSTPSASPSKAINDRVSVYRGDITKLQLDAIVNAANQSLLGGGGVDGAIHRGAGPGLLRECETLNGCATGDAKITEGYELPAKKIIHAVGPIYWQDEDKAPGLLEACYRKSMKLCVEKGLRSIGFSAISTGVYGYPSDEAAKVACRVVREELEKEECKWIERVVFVTFEMKDVRAYNESLP
jgi:O-acetyl-ADP-ribose deacetylase (regulator of RNase III)